MNTFDRGLANFTLSYVTSVELLVIFKFFAKRLNIKEFIIPGKKSGEDSICVKFDYHDSCYSEDELFSDLYKLIYGRA